ncbi:Alpha/Beta hydrolase protein [Mycena epipterygia]|nr:Alpha/Beta hydrolase protein [Mycena epipterygia]
MPSVLRNNSTFTLPKFNLECGISLHSVDVAYRTWGMLNAARNNVMVVCHPFTGSVDVDEWWGDLLGCGRAFDPTRYYIFCANVLGSPYGTTSPLSIEPSTGVHYGPEFPPTTIRDDVRLHKLVLDHLGVSSVAVVVGGSMGGMTALEWPLCFPGYVERIVPMATCAKQSAWCIGWGEAQRQTIYCDALFEDGYYQTQPTQGLAAARMAGLLTYRSRDSYEERFGRRMTRSSSRVLDDATPPLFSAQSYLRYQGAKFAAKFDANCYIHITHKMDTHDITRDRFIPAACLDEGAALSFVLGQLPECAFIVSIDTDGLCLPQEQRTLADGIPRAELASIPSLAGHDGFLVESEQINAIVVDYLHRQFPQFYATML